MSGKTTCKKEWESKSLSEGRDTKGNSAEDSSMESGHFSLQMEVGVKENLKKTA